MNELEIIQEETTLDVISNQMFDVQIATAKKYPRNITRVVDNSIATVTMDENIAATCEYSLPRAGKKIKGASVHLARIIAQYYGNIRVQVKAGEVGKTNLTAYAIAFDLESNYAIQVETRRKILTSKGERYGEDMINTTMLAAMAVAERNAILKVIPKAIIDRVSDAAKNKMIGELNNEQKLIATRKKTIEFFNSKYGLTEEDILEFVGKKIVTAITAEDIVELRGFALALKDGETTIDENFKRFQKQPKKPKDVSFEQDPEPTPEPEKKESKPKTPKKEEKPVEQPEMDFDDGQKEPF